MARVVLYTTVYCGYCTMAKRLLTKKGVSFEEIQCDDRRDLRDWLRGATGQRTVPQIFINDVSVGGFAELVALERAGALDQRLAEPAPTQSTLPT